LRIVLTALFLFVVLAACDSVDGPAVSPSADTEGPYLTITVPPATGPAPAVAPPISTFRWETIDGAADPDLARWALVSVDQHGGDWDAALEYIRDHPHAPEWHPWQSYRPHVDTGSGTSWTTPPLSFQDGRHVFVVQGKMASGAPSDDFDLARNARRVLIPSDIYLRARLTSDFMDPIVATGPWTPPTQVGLPAWTPVEFRWTAHPGHDFEDAMAYRYGWDVENVDDETQWDVPFTPFDGGETCSPPMIFPPGTHTFHLDVINASGFVARIPVTIDFTRATEPR
jgi:hypothetical protein